MADAHPAKINEPIGAGMIDDADPSLPNDEDEMMKKAIEESLKE